ncbi:hypothetical protein [Hymenobacter sp. BT491]|uniref:hypothetical protein n=1 Tax=Hymenobacter sp. BT491 TaxID=2766779 RepID=UPI0016536461|nr:hypothetical protein [Hymenobacter sp. BT491]MBC6989272.1 hypothetical protein [Hymenobacter sp. BT491]
MRFSFGKYFVLCLGALLAPGLTYADDVLADTVAVHQSHRRIVFQFDNRYSLLNGRLVGINGLKLGVEWRNRLRTGAALYLLSSGIPSDEPTPLDLPPATTAEMRFRYVAVYGEYVLIGNRRWELSTPTQFGVGRFFSRYELPNGQVRKSPKELIWLVEPSVASHYRVWRWLGVGAGLGWRQTLFINNALEHELNAPIFYGRVKLFLGDLYKVFRGHERLFSQRGLESRATSEGY